jgi:crossover junction endodeoxyribonuclease RuvC
MTDKKLKHEKRLEEIFGHLEKLIKKERPGLMVMERLFFTRNQKTAIAVGQAQGVILLLAAKYGLEFTYLTPSQIKSIVTGSGNADKKSVQKMLTLLLGLKEEVKQDDRADAIACGYAYCCINQRWCPIDIGTGLFLHLFLFPALFNKWLTVPPRRNVEDSLR